VHRQGQYAESEFKPRHGRYDHGESGVLRRGNGRPARLSEKMENATVFERQTKRGKDSVKCGREWGKGQPITPLKTRNRNYPEKSMRKKQKSQKKKRGEKARPRESQRHVSEDRSTVGSRPENFVTQGGRQNHAPKRKR